MCAVRPMPGNRRRALAFLPAFPLAFRCPPGFGRYGSRRLAPPVNPQMMRCPLAVSNSSVAFSMGEMRMTSPGLALRRSRNTEMIS